MSPDGLGCSVGVVGRRERSNIKILQTRAPRRKSDYGDIRQEAATDDRYLFELRTTHRQFDNRLIVYTTVVATVEMFKRAAEFCAGLDCATRNPKSILPEDNVFEASTAFGKSDHTWDCGWGWRRSFPCF